LFLGGGGFLGVGGWGGGVEDRGVLGEERGCDVVHPL
jgi:hypothetical protein